MLRNLFLIIYFFSYTLLEAQTLEVLQFDSRIYDFGNINESEGAVTHEFRFKNNGKKPVTITDVKASCGCTIPGWTKEAIGPGEEGFVQARYDPYNRPGTFHKDLTVYTDLKGETAKLYIKGYVKPKPKSPTEELTVIMGDLRLKHKIFNMGKVYTREEPAKKAFELYNAGSESIIFKNIYKPEHIAIVLPDTLQPGQLVAMEVSYDAIMKNDLGFFSENITLITNEPEDSIKSLTLFTNIEEYFPPITKEELENAPRLSFGEQIFDFNKAVSGEKVKTQFELTNNGKTPLKIRKVDSNCSCVTATLDKMKLSPGESAIIDVVFDTSNRRGNQQKAITVYSNDPRSPVQRLTVKGSVEVN